MQKYLIALLMITSGVIYTKAQPDWLIDQSPYTTQINFTEDSTQLIAQNGLIKKVFDLRETVVAVHFEQVRLAQTLMRAVQPEALITLDGIRWKVGGKMGQPNQAFLLPEWQKNLYPDSNTFLLRETKVLPIQPHLTWKQPNDNQYSWPPKGKEVVFIFHAVSSSTPGHLAKLVAKVMIEIHYAFYDGIPAYAKWLKVNNQGSAGLKIDQVTTELLSAIERVSWVESGHLPYPLPLMHVETDYAFGGMTAAVANDHVVHWTTDPEYTSQVHYLRQSPCLLQVSPDEGIGVVLHPGEHWTSFRTYVMAFDSEDRERNGLAQRRFYRTVAPWTQENPLMMHVRYADWNTVKNAIDQCVEIGFEMVILTFGSGFNMETDSQAILDIYKQYADYAHQKGIKIGGYSLLASRTINKEEDVMMPSGQTPTFGNSPCLQSRWGQNYFKKLYRFFEYTGFDLLEHDGSYPGDVCMADHHPGHKDLADSQWKQRQVISEFYAWCREKGIYLNVPDYYHLSGSNKIAMGYREVNWSLPRQEQVLHTRQNIFDGTWEKTPSMGWMFVPLTEYHGGGEAATIEPLHTHLKHYEQILVSNLAGGVQACYRGPRLFDTPETKLMVTRWVDWFKQYRTILESDILHLRRADGRDIDYWLHVNAQGKQKALLAVFNPLEQEVVKSIRVPLYYTGLKTSAKVTYMDGSVRSHPLDRDYTTDVLVKVAGKGFAWFLFE